MPRMAASVSVGANAVSSNQLAGLLEEFTRRLTRVRIAGVSSATGINSTVLLNSKAIVNDQLVSFANRYPVVPDDVICEHIVPAGARMVLTFRNTTAGALTVVWFVDTKVLR